MKKIVVISQQERINHDLIAMLTELFPEDFEPCPAGSFSKTDLADEQGT